MPNREAASVLASLPGVTGRVDRAKLERYIEALLSWNARIGLISKHNTSQVLIRLVERSVELWDIAVERLPEIVLQERLRVVDIGSGGGFPGVVWKLLQQEMDLTLVERKEKKAFFLNKVATLLELASFSVIQRDLHELANDARLAGAYDVALMMAVAPPDEVGSAVERLLGRGGVFIIPRGEAETVFPPTIGADLNIHSAVATAHGPVLIYQNARQ